MDIYTRSRQKLILSNCLRSRELLDAHGKWNNANHECCVNSFCVRRDATSYAINAIRTSEALTELPIPDGRETCLMRLGLLFTLVMLVPIDETSIAAILRGCFLPASRA